MKILLVGCGFIGHHVAIKLIEQGHDITVLDKREANSHPNYVKRMAKLPKDLKWTTVDVGILHDVRPAYNQSIDYDVIIYTASEPEAKFIANNIDQGSNDMINGPANILLFYKAPRFVYLSSSMVYGEFHNLRPREDDPLIPIEPYGILKKCSEELVKFYCENKGIEYTIIRPSAVYGPRDKIQRVISKFIKAAINDEELKVKGNYSLDFTYVEDLADGIIQACFSPAAANETFNMTKGKAETIGQAAEIVVNTVGKGNIVFYNHDSLYPVRGALEISKAKSLIGYDPKINLYQGIQLYYDSW